MYEALLHLDHGRVLLAVKVSLRKAAVGEEVMCVRNICRLKRGSCTGDGHGGNGSQ